MLNIKNDDTKGNIMLEDKNKDTVSLDTKHIDDAMDESLRDQLYDHHKKCFRAQNKALELMVKLTGTEHENTADEQYEIACKNTEEAFDLLVKYVLK